MSSPNIKPLKRRYSYSFTNAARFLPLYDRLIDIYNNPAQYNTPSITVTSAHFPGIAPSTLVNKISDGLKWLADKFEIPDEVPAELRPKYGRDSYAHLKLNLKLSASRESVTLSLRVLKTICDVRVFRETINNIPVQETVESAPANLPLPTGDGPSIFRTSVETFLADSNETVIMFKDLHMTESDMLWIKNLLLTTPGLSPYWQGATLTIAKEK